MGTVTEAPGPAQNRNIARPGARQNSESNTSENTPINARNIHTIANQDGHQERARMRSRTCPDFRNGAYAYGVDKQSCCLLPYVQLSSTEPYRWLFDAQRGTVVMENLLSTKQVADRLGVDTKTVLRYLRQGKLKGSRIGRDYRIPESALSTFLTQTDSSPSITRAAIGTAIVNQKGGVGKTTTTFNLGVALSRLGRRVLLIDMDPQAALSLSAGVPIAHLSMSVYQVLLDDKVDPVPVICETISGVDVLPATIDLAAAEIELVNMPLRELVLKAVVTKLRPRYDHILIDCPPSLGLL